MPYLQIRKLRLRVVDDLLKDTHLGVEKLGLGILNAFMRCPQPALPVRPPPG